MRFVKLLREGRGVWGVLHGDVVHTLTEPPFEGVRYDGESLPLSGCRLLAPCEATKIVCIGKNYFDHIHEMKSMLDASNTPAGVGPMQPGDTVEVEVSGIGILCNTIV